MVTTHSDRLAYLQKRYNSPEFIEASNDMSVQEVLNIYEKEMEFERVIKIYHPKLTINPKEIADEMKRLGYKEGRSFSNWTFCLVDALENLYSLETKVSAVFKSLDSKKKKNMNNDNSLSVCDYKKVDKHTRAGKHGKAITCPKCYATSNVYHFSWNTLVCEDCDQPIEKTDWLIKTVEIKFNH